MKKSLYRYAALAGILALAVGLVQVGYAATTTANVKVQSSIRAQATGTPDIGSLSFDIGTAGVSSIDFTNGSGSGAINKMFVDTAATTTSYDLDAGSMLDPAGAAVTFSRIAYVRIIPNTANAAVITVGGDFILTKYLSGWVDDALVIPVHLLGRFEFLAPNATGVAVTATTGDVITVTVSGSEGYTIVIFGS
jgi:hypothetical protein